MKLLTKSTMIEILNTVVNLSDWLKNVVFRLVNWQFIVKIVVANQEYFLYLSKNYFESILKNSADSSKINLRKPRFFLSEEKVTKSSQYFIIYQTF